MIIGLCGFKRTGKSTVAKHLEDKYGYVRVNFKDGLIAEIKQNFPDLLEEMYYHYNTTYSSDNVTYVTSEDDLFEVKPPLMRALMVNYGTEVRRKENPNYWVDIWKLKITELTMKGYQNIVVDDMRFWEEYNAIKGRGGKTIRIVRDDITTGGDHQSETENLEWVTDHVIQSKQGDLEGLYKAVDDILKA